jgi:uncharacterized protein (DUF2461 family)
MGFTEAYYEFFIELALNNQKTWFDVNRARYEADVKKPFLAFVTQLLEKVAALDSRFSGFGFDGLDRFYSLFLFGF